MVWQGILATEAPTPFPMLITNDTYSAHMDRLAQHQGPWLLDFETDGLHAWNGNRIIGVAVGPLDKTIPDAYMPYRHASGNLDRPIAEILDLVHKRRWIAHSAIFEYQMMLAEGFDQLESKPPICTLVGLHVVDENRQPKALKPTCRDLFGAACVAPSDKMDKLLQDRLLAKNEMGLLDASLVAEYGIGDITITRMLFEWIFKRSKHEDTLKVWEDTSQYACVVGRMVHLGVRVDLERVAVLRKRAEARCLDAMRKARDLRGRPINLDSPQQVSKWLKIPSTNDEALERLHTPEAEVVREFRSWSKAVSSYYKPFQAKAVNGVLHCEFRMDGTVSGRLSCSNPNLQAIPRDDELFGIKSAIVPREGMVLLQADYSQAEVRLVSHYSGDANLIRMIQAGGDTHAYVAKEIGVSRQVGKTLNFSVIYGVGAFTLSQRLNCSEHQAEAFLKAYHSRYPGFKRVYDTAEKMARRHRFITMWSRRRRHYNRGPYETPYHKGSSNLIQGGVGEILRERQTMAHLELHKQGVEQILQVHDSGVMEVPIDDAPKIATQVKTIMEDHTRFRVPFIVDVSWGPDLNCKEGKVACQ